MKKSLCEWTSLDDMAVEAHFSKSSRNSLEKKEVLILVGEEGRGEGKKGKGGRGRDMGVGMIFYASFLRSICTASSLTRLIAYKYRHSMRMRGMSWMDGCEYMLFYQLGGLSETLDNDLRGDAFFNIRLDFLE